MSPPELFELPDLAELPESFEAADAPPRTGLPGKAGSETGWHELSALGELPTATGVAVSLLLQMPRKATTGPEVVALLGADPALAARALRGANALGFGHPVTTVEEAVTLLGLPALRRLVMDVSVLPERGRGGCAAFDYVGFWSGSLALAVALEALCERTAALAPAEGYSLGLLARIGQLALATAHPEKYAEVLSRSPVGGRARLLAEERRALFVDHIELARAMFADWGLPERFQLALDGLDEPETLDAADTPPLTRLLALARAVAAGWRTTAADTPGASVLELAERCGLGREEFLAVVERAAERWRERLQTLALPGLSGTEAQRGAPAAHPGRGEREPLRVLVVDDDASSRLLMCQVLRKVGHEVVTATDGLEGLRLALEHDIQLVVTDWLMPELDGVELCRALRSHRNGRRMYIILVTGQDDDASLVEAFEAGADDYVTKPVRLHAVTARLRAGERVLRLQREVELEREANRRYSSELTVANRRFEEAALCDPLTGLPNRRYATRRLEQIWAASRRDAQAFACMLIDVDHFKSLNDTYGHLCGDAVLAEVAAVLRGAARRDDEVCRIGGEEFLVVCANSDLEAALATAERLRAAVETRCVAVQGIERGVTVSIGVAACEARAATPDDLLQAADEAVYAAKRAGRNRVSAARNAAARVLAPVTDVVG